MDNPPAATGYMGPCKRTSSIVLIVYFDRNRISP